MAAMMPPPFGSSGPLLGGCRLLLLPLLRPPPRSPLVCDDGPLGQTALAGSVGPWARRSVVDVGCRSSYAFLETVGRGGHLTQRRVPRKGAARAHTHNNARCGGGRHGSCLFLAIRACRRAEERERQTKPRASTHGVSKPVGCCALEALFDRFDRPRDRSHALTAATLHFTPPTRQSQQAGRSVHEKRQPPRPPLPTPPAAAPLPPQDEHEHHLHHHGRSRGGPGPTTVMAASLETVFCSRQTTDLSWARAS